MDPENKKHNTEEPLVETTEMNTATGQTSGESTSSEVAPETTPPAKHKHADRLAKAYPDKTFATDEEHDAGMDEYLNDLEGYKEKGKSTNKKLINLFEAEPEVGNVVRDMINGATFREALARHLSPEDLTAIEGDPDYEKWNANKTAREDSAAKRRKFEDDYANNIELSQKAVEEFATENNMTEESATDFLSKLDQFIADVNNGNVSKNSLSLFKKALNYDSDMANASEKATIAGRNQNIVASKEAVPATGDGIPKIANSSAVPEVPKAAPDYMSGLVDKINKKKLL